MHSVMRFAIIVTVFLLSITLFLPVIVTAEETITLNGIDIINGENRERAVKLRFSSAIVPDALTDCLTITPPVEKLKFKQGYRERYVLLKGKFAVEGKYQLSIKKTTLFRTVEKKKIPVTLAATTRTFIGPGPDVSFSITGNRHVVEKIGRQILPLSTKNVENIQATLKPFSSLLFSQFDYANGTAAVEYLKTIAEREELLNKQSANPEFAPFQVFHESVPTAPVTETFFIPPSDDNFFSLPLSFRPNNQIGASYLLELTAHGQGVVRHNKRFLQITDLSILYKQSPDSLLLWVTSLHKAEPVANANILLLLSDDSRVALGQTNDKGLLEVKAGQGLPHLKFSKTSLLFEKTTPDLSKAVAVIAKTATDCSYISLDSHRLYHPDASPVTTEKAQEGQSRGRLFTDRGIYRPGDTIHFKGAIRQLQNNAVVPPEKSTLEVRLLDPGNKALLTKQYSLTEFGTIGGEFKIRKFDKLGQYQLEMRPLDDKTTKQLNGLHVTNTFQVQEFERPRHFVEVQFARDQKQVEGYVGVDLTTQVVKATVTPKYYAGGILKQCKVRWKAHRVPATYSVAEFADAKFGHTGSEEFLLESGVAYTDEKGNLTVTVPLDSTGFNGTAALRFTATALDIDGRAATGVATFTPTPKIRVGIKTDQTHFKMGDHFDFKALAIDENNQVIQTGKMSARLLKKSWYYSLKRTSSGEVTYAWQEQWTEVLVTDLTINDGEVTIPILMSDGGEYRLDVTCEQGDDKGSCSYIFETDWYYYDYYTESKANNQREILKTRQMALFPDRRIYSPGNDVVIDFHARRKLTWCLVTVERNGVLKTDVVRIDRQQGQYSLPCLPEYAPNVFVSITGICPRENYPTYGYQVDAGAPHAFYGYREIKVKEKQSLLKVIIAEEQTELKNEPGKIQKIDLLIEDENKNPVEAEIALCVVDESILALTRFPTPTFAGLEHFLRPLQVFSGEGRFDLISQDAFRLITNQPLTGGGGGPAGADLDSQPIRKDFNPLAYFNGFLRTNKEGRTSVSFTLPDSTTTYRVFAVACDKKSGFASGARSLKVTRDFFITPSLPRFLVDGDSFRFPLSLANLSNNSGLATVNVESPTQLPLSAESESTNLNAEERAIIKIHGVANQPARDLAMTFSAKFGNLEDALEEKRSILSKYTKIDHYLTGAFKKKEKLDLSFLASLNSLPSKELEKESLTATLTLSKNLWSRLEPSLNYLIQYPYGCVEQTSSGLIPLIALHHLAKNGKLKELHSDSLEIYIKSGITRLAKMHIPYRGFAYWTGGTNPSYTGTTYALFALSMAKKSGFSIDQESFTQALTWLRTETFNRADDTDRWPFSFKPLAPYVLAINNQIKTADLQVLFGDTTKMNLEEKALYYCTKFQLDSKSDKAINKAIKKLKVFQELSNARNSKGWRTASFWLMLALTLPDSTLKPEKFADFLLSGMMHEGRWSSTADTGYCLMALSAYMVNQATDETTPFDITISAGNKKLQTITMKENTQRIELPFTNLLKAKNLQLRSEGKTAIHYSLQLEHPYVSSTKDKLPLTITRSIKATNGQNIIHVGDIVKVTLNIELPNRKGLSSYDFLAIEDPLPAGLVAINPAITADAESGDIEEQKDYYYRDDYYILRPDHEEFRDDSIRLFRNWAWEGKFQYEYYARAVCEGEFQLRPAKIQMMYEPTTKGFSAGGNIVILPTSK